MCGRNATAKFGEDLVVDQFAEGQVGRASDRYACECTEYGASDCAKHCAGGAGNDANLAAQPASRTRAPFSAAPKLPAARGGGAVFPAQHSVHHKGHEATG